MSASLLRAMAVNYSGGHNWDHLDSKACNEAADLIDTLRAQLEAAEAEAARLGELERVNDMFRTFVIGEGAYERFCALQARAEAAEADAARADAVPAHVRRLVGKLDQWNARLSYNESYVGEPEGLFKATLRELAKAVDAIYTEPQQTIDPHARVVIYTDEYPSGIPASELIAARTKEETNHAGEA